MRSQVVVLVSFLSILLINCSKKESQEIQPTISDITESVYASGVIKAKDQYIVYPTVSGILKKTNMTIRNLYLLLYCLIFEPESKSTCYEFA